MKSIQRQGGAVAELTIIIPLAENVQIGDRTGRITSTKIDSNETHTTVRVVPRHIILGGGRASVTIEYDAYLQRE